MNNKEKLNQIKLTQWAACFQEQAASGQTVKSWCVENNISIHSYNYWKHKLKLEYMDSILPVEPDIVALSPNLLQDSTTLQENPSHTIPTRKLHDSCDSHDLNNAVSICITSGDISISAGPSVSVEKIMQIIKVVRHA
jgi:hypothetical protein